MKTIAAVIVTASFLAGLYRIGLLSLLVKSTSARSIPWIDMGSTPEGHMRYTPQGLTWVRNKLVFANTWKDMKSRVYEIDPDSMVSLRHFDMPTEAVHTSGLAWDGDHLWAVDYRANRAYCIDLEESMLQGVAQVVGSFDTALRGTSACCIVDWNNQKCIVISDFMNSRETLFVDYKKALKTGTAKGCTLFKYRNEGFSQGLEHNNGFIYESENKLGIDIINKLDLKILAQSRDARKATVAQYRAPSRGIEDLAWSGEELWTSDESIFRFFRWTPESD